MAHKPVLATLLLVTSLMLAGCPSCPYDSRCKGNTLLTCSVGVDQMVGDPARSSRDCRAPNPVCIDLSSSTAICAMGREFTCEASFDPICDQGAIVSCEAGYRVAEGCAEHGNECVLHQDQPHCALPPTTECDSQDFAAHCDGTRAIQCHNGLVRADDCALRVPALQCKQYENEYGKSAYCSG